LVILDTVSTWASKKKKKGFKGARKGLGKGGKKWGIHS